MKILLHLFLVLLPVTACSQNAPMNTRQDYTQPYTRSSLIADVAADPVFGEYGRLIFPVNTGYWNGETLEQLRLTWYNYIDPDKTVEIVNYMKQHASAGEQIFFDIYTETEKQADPAKRNTGLFYFRGGEGKRFAVCNAGGGFSYVGAMHDSYPHALELGKRGYHAFALIYRPGAQTACEDLARAVDLICSMAGEMGIDTSCYSLWGGSAGARMAAWVGGYGVQYFGGVTTQKAGTVVMQYTGLSDYSDHEAPTYANCGTGDGIASWQTMQNRLNGMTALGIPTEFHAYQGLPHGFGLGTGTVAEGWIDDAVRFWEAQMPQGTMATEHVPAAGPNASAANATAYDLQGCPVSSGYKGIIIQNGNKYLNN